MRAPFVMSTRSAVRVSKAAVGHIAQDVAIGQHAFISDAPVASGGDDLGPDPHDLIDAALASCTALTLHLYARRKGWALVDVIVRVGHDEHDGVYSMQRDIELIGTLSAEERTRLLEIAEKCPVRRTLNGTFRIVSQLVE